jgi:hypothetical protein
MSLSERLALVLGAAMPLALWAQAPAGQAPSAIPDYSGIYEAAPYVGVPDVGEPAVYPFTATAERALAAYDPLASDPRQTDDCAPETMPGILWTGNPMELTQEPGRIVIRYERGNTRRSIPIASEPRGVDTTHTALGYSIARWVGNVLTIETTQMLGGVIFNNRGQPISPDARITERYWREPGENDLRLQVVIEDPVNYTEPVELERRWIWAPDEEIGNWVCVSLGPRDAEPPDIDELARMLEQL